MPQSTQKEYRGAACCASSDQHFKIKARGGRGAGKFCRLDQRKNKKKISREKSIGFYPRDSKFFLASFNQNALV